MSSAWDRRLACLRSGAVLDEPRSDFSTRPYPSAGMTASMPPAGLSSGAKDSSRPATLNTISGTLTRITTGTTRSAAK
jgi:hypothetical protein